MASLPKVENEADSGRIRRRRRSRTEVSALIEKAARELFAERGYAAATTREIAQRADVSETLLFRYFGDKAKLFERTVAGPLDRLMADFLAKRDSGDDGVQHMFADVYELLVANRGLLEAMVAGGDAGEAAGNRRCFASFLDLAVRDRLEHGARTGFDNGINPALAVPLAFGMMAASVLMEDWIFPDGAPCREEVIVTLQAMCGKALDLGRSD